MLVAQPSVRGGESKAGFLFLKYFFLSLSFHCFGFLLSLRHWRKRWWGLCVFVCVFGEGGQEAPLLEKQGNLALKSKQSEARRPKLSLSHSHHWYNPIYAK